MSKTTNTILTITIIIFMLSLLIYGYCATQKLDEKQNVKVVSTISKHINYKEEKPTNFETIESIEEEDDSENDEFEEYIEELDEEIEEKPIETPKPIAAETPIIKNTTAAFRIIAGSFSNRENAENKVTQLEKQGIEAEIVHLHNSSLHAISIAKADSEKEANDKLEAFKTQHKIKAYVYKNPQKK